MEVSIGETEHLFFTATMLPAGLEPPHILASGLSPQRWPLTGRLHSYLRSFTKRLTIEERCQRGEV